MAQKDKESQTTRHLAEAAFPTVIGPGISIRGDLVSEEAVDVAGRFEGDSVVAAHYRVREGGRVVGAIQARTLAVEGAVQSSKIVTDRLEIGACGRIEGQVQARVVTVASGGRFEGKLDMPLEGTGSESNSSAGHHQSE